MLAPSDITLSGLHDLLQLAMGWTDAHLHEFRFRGLCHGPADPERGAVEVIRNPQQPRHKEPLEWVGGNYDPEEFSIEAINRVLPGRKKRAARSSG